MKLQSFQEMHGFTTIAIGNGTACRETESAVAKLIGRFKKSHYTLLKIIHNCMLMIIWFINSMIYDSWNMVIACCNIHQGRLIKQSQQTENHTLFSLYKLKYYSLVPWSTNKLYPGRTN